MTEVLGHERYGIQGGDWGAIIGSRLAQLHPEAVVGLHTNYPLGASDIDPAWSADATPLEREHLAHLAAYAVTERGYSAIQATKPQTARAGAGGLARGSRRRGSSRSSRPGATAVSSVFAVDDLLTNLMFYWAPNSVASSAAMYFESRLDPEGRAHPIPDVPVGVASFPREITRVSRRWAEAKYRVARWTDMPRADTSPRSSSRLSSPMTCGGSSRR